MYEVIAGSIGRVHFSDDLRIAATAYFKYVDLSKSGEGKIGYEEITLLMNGEPLKGFLPLLNEDGEMVGALNK